MKTPKKSFEDVLYERATALLDQFYDTHNMAKKLKDQSASSDEITTTYMILADLAEELLNMHQLLTVQYKISFFDDSSLLPLWRSLVSYKKQMGN